MIYRAIPIAILALGLFTPAGYAANVAERAAGVFSSSELNEPPWGGVTPGHCTYMHGKASAGCELNTNAYGGLFSSGELNEPPWGGVIPGHCRLVHGQPSAGCTAYSYQPHGNFSSSELSEAPTGGVTPGQ
jgi:hypothetical protein